MPSGNCFGPTGRCAKICATRRSRLSPVLADTGMNAANGWLASLSSVGSSSVLLPSVSILLSTRNVRSSLPSSISISVRSCDREPAGLDDEQRHVAILERLVDLPRHEPMQRALRAARMPRRVDEHGLIGAAIQHAEHALPRRVRLVRDDAELLADEGVQQRRLADVRPADDRHEAAAAAWVSVLAHRSAPRASLRRLLARRGGGSVLDR